MQLAIRGHYVEVITPEMRERKETVEDLPFRVTRVKPSLRIGNSSLSFKVARRIKDGFDIIHLHGPYLGDGNLVSILLDSESTPLVYTYHNDIIYQNLMKVIPWADRVVTERMIFKKSTRLIFHSRDYAFKCKVKNLVRQNDWKLRIIPNGVDTSSFKITNSDKKVDFGFDDRSKVVLFVGALDRAHAFKGIPVLLRAIAKIHDSKIKFVIAGAGGLLDSYKTLSDRLGVSSKTRFLGFVEEENLPRLYQSCDAVVLPSTMIECFGIVLIEGMASGKPVIASDLPGVRSVVKDSKAGLLCKPGDSDDLATAIVSLMNNEKEAVEMGLNGRKACERNFDWRIIGENLERLYFELKRDSIHHEKVD